MSVNSCTIKRNKKSRSERYEQRHKIDTTLASVTRTILTLKMMEKDLNLISMLYREAQSRYREIRIISQLYCTDNAVTAYFLKHHGYNDEFTRRAFNKHYTNWGKVQSGLDR